MRKNIPAFAAGAAVALAVLTLLVRIPTTLDQLKSTGKHNDTYDAFGRSAAAAGDSLAIDNGFVAAATQLLPANATYSVAMPSRAVIASGAFSEITYDAVPPFMRYVLLPRRQVPVSAAEYILCYGCTLSKAKVRWLWVGGPDARVRDERIGRRR